LLGGFKDFDGFPPHGVEIATLADTVFGREVIKAAVDTTFGTLHGMGLQPEYARKNLHGPFLPAAHQSESKSR